MTSWTLRIFIVGVFAVVGFLGGVSHLQAQSDEQKEMIGKPAPNMKGNFALNGEPVSLADLKGKVVLVDFWAVWCGPCIATFPHLREWHEKYHDKGLRIVGMTYYNKIYDFDAEKGKLKLKDGIKITVDAETKKRVFKGKPFTEEEEQEMLKKFADHFKLKHLLMAVSREDWTEIGKNYHIRGIPTAAIIDQKGVVRMIRVGSGAANAKALEEMIQELLD